MKTLGLFKSAYDSIFELRQITHKIGNRLAFLVVLSFTALQVQASSCSSIEIQSRLNNGETPISIYTNCHSLDNTFSVNALYNKKYLGYDIAYLDTATGRGIITTGNLYGTQFATSADNPIYKASYWVPPYGGSQKTTGANGLNIFDGYENTKKILATYGDNNISNDPNGTFNYAAWLAHLYSEHYGREWFLPSINELKVMMANSLNPGFGTDGPNCPVAGISRPRLIPYWSSTELNQGPEGVKGNAYTYTCNGYQNDSYQGTEKDGSFWIALGSYFGDTVIPTITSLPSTAQVMETITIKGLNFGIDDSAVTVYFHGGITATASPSTLTATSMTVTVPVTATSGKVYVSVGSDQSLLSLTDLEVTLRPVITSLTTTPKTENISAYLGSTLIISGHHFSPNIEKNTVKFTGSLEVKPTVVSATSMSVTIPSGTTTGKVTVNTDSTPSPSSSQTLTILKPEITALSKTKLFVGEMITITGMGFAENAKDNTVTFCSESPVTGIISGTPTSTTINVSVATEISGCAVTVKSYSEASEVYLGNIYTYEKPSVGTSFVLNTKADLTLAFGGAMSNIVSIGVVYGGAMDPTINNVDVSFDYPSTATHTLDTLLAGKQYYSRPYIKVNPDKQGIEYLYGDQVLFKTLPFKLGGTINYESVGNRILYISNGNPNELLDQSGPVATSGQTVLIGSTYSLLEKRASLKHYKLKNHKSWGCNTKSITGARGTSVGTGLMNSIDLLESCYTNSTAPKTELTGYTNLTPSPRTNQGGVFIPSKGELKAIYDNRAKLPGLLPTSWVWSSTQDSSTNAWTLDFSDGTESSKEKTKFTSEVLLISAFTAMKIPVLQTANKYLSKTSVSITANVANNIRPAAGVEYKKVSSAKYISTKPNKVAGDFRIDLQGLEGNTKYTARVYVRYIIQDGYGDYPSIYGEKSYGADFTFTTLGEDKYFIGQPYYDNNDLKGYVYETTSNKLPISVVQNVDFKSNDRTNKYYQEPWGCYDTATGATSRGKGKSNTDIVVKADCSPLFDLIGESGWFLPSTIQLGFVQRASEIFGGFKYGGNYCWWSSTENYANYIDGKPYLPIQRYAFNLRAITNKELNNFTSPLYKGDLCNTRLIKTVPAPKS